MTDEELIRMFRSDPTWMGRNIADRIEALVKERDAAEHRARMRKGFIEEARDERDRAEARTERLEALLREARRDLEVYITHEYPKDEHPYYERMWNLDMELCRRIDAALPAVTQPAPDACAEALSEMARDDAPLIRAILPAMTPEVRELVEAAKEVGRISDRDHVAWRRLADALAAFSAREAP